MNRRSGRPGLKIATTSPTATSEPARAARPAPCRPRSCSARRPRPRAVARPCRVPEGRDCGGRDALEIVDLDRLAEALGLDRKGAARLDGRPGRIERAARDQDLAADREGLHAARRGSRGCPTTPYLARFGRADVPHDDRAGVDGDAHLELGQALAPEARVHGLPSPAASRWRRPPPAARRRRGPSGRRTGPGSRRR